MKVGELCPKTFRQTSTDEMKQGNRYCGFCFRKRLSLSTLWGGGILVLFFSWNGNTVRLGVFHETVSSKSETVVVLCPVSIYPWQTVISRNRYRMRYWKIPWKQEMVGAVWLEEEDLGGTQAITQALLLSVGVWLLVHLNGPKSRSYY